MKILDTISLCLWMSLSTSLLAAEGSGDAHKLDVSLGKLRLSSEVKKDLVLNRCITYWVRSTDAVSDYRFRLAYKKDDAVIGVSYDGDDGNHIPPTGRPKHRGPVCACALEPCRALNARVIKSVTVVDYDYGDAYKA